MKVNDDKLTALFKQWRGPEPAPGFEAGVWRRIRQTAPQGLSAKWAEFVRGWLTEQPAWATVTAVIAGMAIGAWAGLAPLSRAPRATDVALLQPGSIAANYLSMISGGAR